MYNLGFKEAGEPEIKLPRFTGLCRKQGNSKKKIYLGFIDYTKAFDCVDHNQLWQICKEMGIPDHLACILRNMYMLVKKD